MKNSLLLAASAALFVSIGGVALAEECPDATQGCTYSEPEQIDQTSESTHGSLPGDDNSKWSYDEGQESELSEDDWETTDHSGPTTEGNTTTETWTQEQDTTRYDEAVNPGGNTPGTDRFDATVTTTYEREAEKATIAEEPQHASGCYNSVTDVLLGKGQQSEEACNGTWYP